MGLAWATANLGGEKVEEKVQGEGGGKEIKYTYAGIKVIVLSFI